MMKLKIQFICFIIFLIIPSIKADRKDDLPKFLNDEGKLFRDLTNIELYEANARPAMNSTSGPTTVEIGLSLIQIMGIDEEKQTFEILAWMRKRWKDLRLKWKPEEYGGIKHIRIPHDKLWLPDIVLYNGAFETGESSGFGLVYHSLPIIYSDGTILWIPPARLKATCMLDMSNFPFDTQNCHVKLGSWTYSSHQIDVQFMDGNDKIDTSDHTESNNWQLKSSNAVRTDKKYACCEETYPDLKFNFELQRKRSYYSYMLVLPGLIMAFLLPVMFLLPIGRPEKIQMGCTILICLTLLTLLLETMVPTAHSTVPFIEAYYLGNFIITGFSLALSVLILNISRFSSQPPRWLTKVTDMCAKCCCMTSSSGATYRNYKIQMQSGNDENPIMMDTDGASMTGKAEWVVIATVIDRFFLFVSLFIAILVTIGMVSHT